MNVFMEHVGCIKFQEECVRCMQLLKNVLDACNSKKEDVVDAYNSKRTVLDECNSKKNKLDTCDSKKVFDGGNSKRKEMSS